MHRRRPRQHLLTELPDCWGSCSHCCRHAPPALHVDVWHVIGVRQFAVGPPRGSLPRPTSPLRRALRRDQTAIDALAGL